MCGQLFRSYGACWSYWTTVSKEMPLWSCSHLIQDCTVLKNVLQLCSVTRAWYNIDIYWDLQNREMLEVPPLHSTVVIRCLPISKNEACCSSLFKPWISTLKSEFPSSRGIFSVPSSQGTGCSESSSTVHIHTKIFSFLCLSEFKGSFPAEGIPAVVALAAWRSIAVQRPKVCEKRVCSWRYCSGPILKKSSTAGPAIASCAEGHEPPWDEHVREGDKETLHLYQQTCPYHDNHPGLSSQIQ